MPLDFISQLLLAANPAAPTGGMPLPSDVGRSSFPEPSGAGVSSWPELVDTSMAVNMPSPTVPTPSSLMSAANQRFNADPMEQVNSILAAQAQRPPNAITGSTRSYVDVPASLARSDARFQQNKPLVPTQVVQAPRKLPAMFESLQAVSQGAEELSGYNPRNPPSVHTLSEQQFLALNPLQQSQYQAATMRRKQMIDEAKAKYTALLNFGLQAERDKSVIGARESTEIAREKQDREAASADLKTAEQQHREASKAKSDATAAQVSWQSKMNAGIASGLLRVDTTTGMVRPTGVDDPKAIALANDLAITGEKIAADLARAQADEDDVFAALTEARRRVARSGQRVFSPATQQPANGAKVKVRNPQGVVGLIPSANVSAAIQRGYTLVQ